MKVDKKTPICEVCANSVGCNCGDAGESGCKFQMMKKEDTIKTLFIANELTKTEEGEKMYPPAIKRAMMRKYYMVYDGTMYDIARYGFYHDICPECDGSGVAVGASIGVCEKCGGFGVIEKSIDPNYTEYWMHYDITKGFSANKINLLGICHTEREAANLARRSGSKYGPVLFNKRLGDVVSIFNNDEELIAITAINQDIVTAGDWQSIHNYFGIEEWQDIERFFDGTIKVMSKKEFSNTYEINTVEFMSNLYVHVISDIMSSYVYSASYKEAPMLWSRYVGVFNTLTKIHDNIGKHLATNEPIMVMDDQINLLDKICNDFKLIGMVINRNTAAHLIQITRDLLPNVVSAVTEFNAVAVFLTEYIMISGEYATITED